MSWKVSLRAAARADLHEAWEWYEKQRPGLGDEFLAFAAEAFLRLRQFPERPTIYYRGFRRIMTERFPYKIFYRAEGGQVIVFRILHASRDHTWRLR